MIYWEDMEVVVDRTNINEDFYDMDNQKLSSNTYKKNISNTLQVNRKESLCKLKM